MKKIFLAIWGDWEPAINSYVELTQVIDSTFIVPRAGYSIEDITKVDNLKVGEFWHSEYGNHVILRTQ